MPAAICPQCLDNAHGACLGVVLTEETAGPCLCRQHGCDGVTAPSPAPPYDPVPGDMPTEEVPPEEPVDG